MDGLHPAKWEMIEAGGRTAQSFGVNRLLGQIYMLLYLSEDPVCLDGIAEALGVSKASVSIACRQLESWGAVSRTWLKGDRKDYYSPERDFRRILSNGILSSVEKKLDSAQIQIERSRRLLEEQPLTDGDGAFVREQLDEADRFRQRIASVLKNPLVQKLFLSSGS